MLHLDRIGSLVFIASLTSAVHGHGSTVVVVCSSVVVVEVVVIRLSVVVVVVVVVVVAEKVILVLKNQIFEKVYYFSVKVDFDGCTMRIHRAASEINCHNIFIIDERLGAMQVLFYGTKRKGQSQ